MRLNIKNPETDRLARQLAALTGETAAVTEAVRERLHRIKSGGIAARVLETKKTSVPLARSPKHGSNTRK